MNYEWKQVIFSKGDFSGAGHYIVREPTTKINRPEIWDSGYLSTIMYKIGWNNRPDIEEKYCLIAMSDGMVTHGYYSNTTNKDGESKPVDEWIWNPFISLEMLCDYLNNNPYKSTFRFATQEEVVRVILTQKNRYK